MKTSRYTDSQIMAILKQAEAGTPVPQLCREHGMSSASFYKWCAKYDDMGTLMMAHLKELEAENQQLKKMYAEERLKAEIAREVIAKKMVAPSRRKEAAQQVLEHRHIVCAALFAGLESVWQSGGSSGGCHRMALDLQ